MKSVRKSNFELLRIICMIMIIAHHISVHGKIINIYSLDSFSINKFWIYFIRIGGKLGVNLFILLSGYFLINQKKLKVSKVLKFWLQVFFYSLIIYSIFVIFTDMKFGLVRFFTVLLPISFREWWFASTYFILYLISPYINLFLTKLSKTNYKKLLILTTIMWCIIPTFIHTNLESNDLIWFMYLYSIAGYIKLYKDDIKVNVSKCFIIAFITYIITTLICIFIGYLSLKYKFFYKYIFYEIGMRSIPELLMTICIFLGFKSMDIKYNKVINVIASSTFGIYLIHDHDFVRPYLWINLFKVSKYYNSIYLIPYIIFIILSVFIVCSIIELIRIYLFEKQYMKLVNKFSTKLDDIINKILKFKILDKIF